MIDHLNPDLTEEVIYKGNFYLLYTSGFFYSKENSSFVFFF